MGFLSISLRFKVVLVIKRVFLLATIIIIVLSLMSSSSIKRQYLTSISSDNVCFITIENYEYDTIVFSMLEDSHIIKESEFQIDKGANYFFFYFKEDEIVIKIATKDTVQKDIIYTDRLNMKTCMYYQYNKKKITQNTICNIDGNFEFKVAFKQ